MPYSEEEKAKIAKATAAASSSDASNVPHATATSTFAPALNPLAASAHYHPHHPYNLPHPPQQPHLGSYFSAPHFPPHHHPAAAATRGGAGLYVPPGPAPAGYGLGHNNIAPTAGQAAAAAAAAAAKSNPQNRDVLPISPATTTNNTIRANNAGTNLNLQETTAASVVLEANNKRKAVEDAVLLCMTKKSRTTNLSSSSSSDAAAASSYGKGVSAAKTKTASSVVGAAAIVDLTTNQELMDGKNKGGKITVSATATTDASVATDKAVVGDKVDPPGFEAFQQDPSFINCIMSNRLKPGNNDPLLGPLARGLVNMSDDQLYSLSRDTNDTTIKTFLTNVIMPLLGISDNRAKTNTTWQGYAHLSSDHLMNLARNFFYVRRSSMKAAVQVAFYEMRKNHEKIMRQQKGNKGTSGGGNSTTTTTANATTTTTTNSQEGRVLKRRIQDLECALQRQKTDHAKMIEEIEDIYEKDIEVMRDDHRITLEEIRLRHTKEVESLREEIMDMKCSHREFFDNYVQAATETVHRLGRVKGKKPLSSPVSRSVSDL